MAKRNCSILVIDYDQDNAKFLAKVLKENGHSVLVARDAGHAVSILEYPRIRCYGRRSERVVRRRPGSD